MRYATHRPAGMRSRVTPLSAVALVLLIVLGACSGELTVASSTVATALTSHVLNITLSEADGGPKWPATTAALAVLTPTVNNTVCSSFTVGVSHCYAFLVRVSNTTLALQLSVVTLTAFAGNFTYYQLLQWADSNSMAISTVLTRLTSACATVLGTPLTSLDVSAGVYTVPCRTSNTYFYLPACAAAEVPVTTVYILSPSSDVKAYFSAYLCGPIPTMVCSMSIDVHAPSITSQYTVVEMTGLPNALEAVLAYVADVRASFLGSPQRVGPPVGNPALRITAKAVELRNRGMHAVLFSTSESNRSHTITRVKLECPASFSYWALVLIAILPVCAILFRYMWYRGRQWAKKQERRRIMDDEMHNMQRYMTSGDAQGTENGPPPGFDTSAAGISNTTPVWAMDANGSYYDANIAAQAEAGTPQTYVDPNTAETYQYVDDGAYSAGGAVATAAAAAPQASQQPSSTTGDNAIYETYADPKRGEMYQYTTDATTADQEQRQTSEFHAAEDAEDAAPNDGYQTNLDPNTVEAYQYTTADADADASGYQYGGPETGETYEYVDQTTGETYQYATQAGENNDEAAEQGYDAAGTGNVYVDPNTGEAYQYETPQP
ncbi:hypothetical protein Q4I30_007220 [Leishmania utingensis]|uniref:Uncharacterized protein n=1 Tax=Leishmania utingensis TaxID=653362 RepID=A0AAW3A1N3_9TRYP